MSYSWEIRWRDYYKILQVHPTASQEIIKAAYQRLARQYHPDSTQQPSSASRMAEINEAYEVLSNLELRRLYHLVWLQKRRESENTYRQERETRSTPPNETSEPPAQTKYAERSTGYRGLAQSKTAIFSAVGMILGLDIITLVFAAILSDTLQFDISPVSLIFDLLLIIFLLRGKNWARIWILVRLVIGLIFFGIQYIGDANYWGLFMYVGITITLLILLTGSSTRRRIILGLSIFIITIIGTTSQFVSILVPSEVSDYTIVNVDTLTLEIPNNWPNTSNLYDYEYMSSIDTEYTTYDAYSDKTGNASIEIIVLNMDNMANAYGATWEGWEDFEAYTGFSQEAFIDTWMDEAMTEFSNPILILSDYPTIRNQKYCEYIYTCAIEGVNCYAYFWWIISQHDLGIVALTCTSEHWATFEECWDYVKYSASLD